MTLTVTNDGTEPLRYETALHTHFHVGDLTQVSYTDWRAPTISTPRSPGTLPACSPMSR